MFWNNGHTILHRTIYHMTISPNLFSFEFYQISTFTSVWLGFVFTSRTDTKTLYLAFCHLRLWLKQLSFVNCWRLFSYANWVTSLINDIIVIYRAADKMFLYLCSMHTYSSQCHICLQLPNIAHKLSYLPQITYWILVKNKECHFQA